jgi:hypothetical protein
MCPEVPDVKKMLLSMITALSLVAVPMTANAQTTTQTTKSLSIPVSGAGSGATLSGVFQLQKFAVRNGNVVALGTLTGTVTDTATGLVTSVVQNIALPVAVGQATCDILHLDLGPLSLNLLGLQIDLSRIVLDITAQSGAGNLLGNLLCAVAGLLDNPSGLAKLLNDILAILG